ncbi:Manganese/iron superoxide dismutase, partial [Aspergillus avenaceus]
MTLHHQKHHNTYITNLNTLLTAQSTAQATNNVPELIALQAKIKFHGGGHINHSLFWTNLAPYNAPETDLAAAAPALQEAIRGEWGSVGAFREAFRGVLLGVQGSGWGWLVKRGERLEIVVTKDQDPVVGGVPVLGVDMWEHAYYLQ